MKKKTKRLEAVDLEQLEKVDGGTCYCTDGSTISQSYSVTSGPAATYHRIEPYMVRRQPYSASVEHYTTTTYSC